MNKTTLSLIVAASNNNVIGVEGRLPWHLPDDLKRFKALTMGKPIVMGRLTHESIGRALPGRKNIVISRQSGYRAENCQIVASVAEALDAAGPVEEVMVIGGGEIYRQCLPLAGRIYLTRVHVTLTGDTVFPELGAAEWNCVASEEVAAGAAGEPAFSFQVFERFGPPTGA